MQNHKHTDVACLSTKLPFGVRTQKLKDGKLSYYARFGNNGNIFYTQSYNNEEEAALAYDWAMRIIHGKNAALNFPDVLTPAGASHLIRKSKNQFFSVNFRKRTTNEIRKLYCQIINVEGEFYQRRAIENNLITVKSLNPPGIRLIPVENIFFVAIECKHYEVYQKEKRK